MVIGDLLRASTARVLDEAAAADLAEAALDSGREDEALAAVERAARQARTSPALWQWTALLHRALDRHGEALSAYDAAARLAPQDARIAHGIARTRLEAGLPAFGAFERARALAPHDGEVLLGRAAAQCGEGQAARAIEQLEATLALTPEWFAGHETVARLHWEHGDRSRFVRTVERALTARPRNVTLWRTLLGLLDHAQRYDDLLDAATRAQAAVGEHPVVIGNMAIACAELGRRAEADVLFARLADSPDPFLRIRHARHLLRSGAPEPASALLETLRGGSFERLAWPYLGLAWRMTNDPRWAWYEGDDRLVRAYDLTDSLPPLDRLAAVLRGLHRASHQPLDQSLRGGTQTDGVLFHRLEEDIVALRTAIAAAVRVHIDQLPPPDADHPTLRQHRDRPIRFSGSWSVRLTGAGFHANHNHPAGWLSSALYLALPNPTPGDEAKAGWLSLGAPQAELGLSLPATRHIEPRPGRLVLFPSTMWHGTLPFAAGERLTVAFDVADPI